MSLDLSWNTVQNNAQYVSVIYNLAMTFRLDFICSLKFFLSGPSWGALLRLPVQAAFICFNFGWFGITTAPVPAGLNPTR